MNNPKNVKQDWNVKMSQLSINQIPTGGKIYELKLKPDQTIYDVWREGEKDGLDQVYFKMGDTHYMAEGDGLDLSGFKKGFMQRTEFIREGEKPVTVHVMGIDNEVNTAWEGLKHVGKGSLALATTGLVGAGGVAGYGAKQIYPAVTLFSSGSSSMKLAIQSMEVGVGQMVNGMDRSINAVDDIAKLALRPTPQLPVPIEPPATGIGVWIKKGLNKVTGTVDQVKHGVDVVSKTPLIEQKSLEAIEGLKDIKAATPYIRQGIQHSQEGVQSLTTGTKLVESSTRLFKKATTVAGIGLAVAGTVAIGGAIYGAVKTEKAEALKDFRGNEQ